MNTFVIADPAKCIGCYSCEVACAFVHSSGEETLSAAQFAPRLTVVRTAKVGVPVQCHQCEDAPCAAVCSTGAISFVNDHVQVNQKRCIGCKYCMIACPYGAMGIVAIERMVREGTGANERTVRVRKFEALKCDLCNTLSEGPACIRVCPTKALRKVDPEAVAKEIKKRKVIAAEEMALRGH
jgi:electron transport protein HydN